MVGCNVDINHLYHRHVSCCANSSKPKCLNAHSAGVQFMEPKGTVEFMHSPDQILQEGGDARKPKLLCLQNSSLYSDKKFFFSVTIGFEFYSHKPLKLKCSASEQISGAVH